MIKLINREIYLDLAQNGARKLFDFEGFVVLDGVKDDEQSYFIIDNEYDEYYQIDLLTSYELVTMFYGETKNEYILEFFEELFNQLAGEMEEKKNAK